MDGWEKGGWAISAPQWANRPCNAPTWLYRVSKEPSVNADLAIYSHAVDVLGQCMSESLILGHNMDSILVTAWSVFVNPVSILKGFAPLMCKAIILPTYSLPKCFAYQFAKFLHCQSFVLSV